MTVTTANDQASGLPTMTYRYFIDGSLAAVEHSDPNTPDVSYAYNDPLARLTAHTDQLGTTTYSYIPFTGSQNGAGELYQVNGPWADDTLRYAYDWQGRLQSRTVLDDSENPLHSVAYTFDTLGRVTTETNNLGTFTYQYAPGNHTAKVNAVQFPITSGIEVAYDYYPTVGTANDDRLKEIHTTGPGGTISKFGYQYAEPGEVPPEGNEQSEVGNPNGRIRQWTQQQGGASALRNYTFAYDRNSQLTDATVKDASDNVIKNWSWQYDAAGNRLRESVDTASTYTEANELNQLLQIGDAGTTLVEGTVDKPSIVMVNDQQAAMFALPGGDFLFRRTVPVNEGQNTITVEATDASQNVRTNVYTVEIGGVQKTLEYDLNGNLRYERDSSGAVLREFQWDARNRLLAIIDGDNKTEFEYDGLDRRVRIVEKENDVEQSNVTFLWDGSEILQKRNEAADTVLRNYFDDGFTEGNDVYFYAKDHLGSIREVISAEGQTIESRYEYTPWGGVARTGGTGAESDFLYTGHYYHAPSELFLTHYRQYSPELGRWLSRDPLGEIAGVNLYIYTFNDPLSYIDPDGRIPVPVISGLIGGGLGALAGGILAALDDCTPWWQGAAAGGLGGFVSGATFGAAAPTTLGGGLLIGGLGGAAGGATSSTFNETVNALDGKDCSKFEPGNILKNAAWGGLFGAAGGAAGAVGGDAVMDGVFGFTTNIWASNLSNWF